MSADDTFIFPTSFAQQRLWFLDQMIPGTAFYNMSQATRFSFPIDPGILEKSLNEIVRRHETLRTTFRAVNGQPCQVIAASKRLDLHVLDLSKFPKEQREQMVADRANADAGLPFDLANGPLLRTALIRMSDADYVFLVAMHHIISDVWSMDIFFKELNLLYESFSYGKPSPLPELPLQYADYAVWQHNCLKGAFLEDQVIHWKKQLSGLTSLNLPLDKKRPPAQTHRGDHVLLEVPKELSDALRLISQEENATMFMTLLTAFVILLQRYSGQDDIVVGAPVAGRNEVEIEDLIGFFVNTIVIRTRVPEDTTFSQLLQSVKSATLDAFAHSDLPFEKLVEELHPERDMSRNPMFQVLFLLAATNSKAGADINADPDLEVKTNTSKFDLTLSLAENQNGINGFIEYNTDLFFEERIRKMCGHYCNLLQSIAEAPDALVSDLNILGKKEIRQLLFDWNNCQRNYPAGQLVHEIIADQARRVPDAIAMIYDEESWTYGQLDLQSNQLGRYLQELTGRNTESVIAVCMARRPAMIMVHLAVLKSGCTFMPLDSSYPVERLCFMLEDSGAKIVFTDSDSPELPVSAEVKVITLDAVMAEIKSFSSEILPTFLLPQHRAYMMYTSGSTGRPKGVELTHAGLLNLVQWNIQTYGITPADRCLQMATPAYDAYIYEIFPCLAGGASACMIDDFSRTSVPHIVNMLVKRNVTIAFLPTALGEVLVNVDWPGEASLRILACAGEKMMRRPDNPTPFEFMNLYGPTENTVIASYATVTSNVGWTPPPIGRPVGNVRLYILDKFMNPVPTGNFGELYIGGKGVARGYLNRPRLTAEKFVPDPFGDEPGARLYRTGDWVKYLPDGNIDFATRIDNQIKLRGFRIELEEIEKLLYANAGVKEAAVVLNETAESEKFIEAFVVLNVGCSLTRSDLKELLREKLPAFMVPSSVVFQKELPKSPSGKIDKKSLAGLRTGSHRQGDVLMTAETEMEKLLSKLWAEFLKVDELGVQDNFFDMGGHSLMMAQVHYRLRETFNAEINLIDLFRYPTIRSLAKFMETREKSQPSLTIS